jgi:hypothetical protein
MRQFFFPRTNSSGQSSERVFNRAWKIARAACTGNEKTGLASPFTSVLTACIRFDDDEVY